MRIKGGVGLTIRIEGSSLNWGWMENEVQFCVENQWQIQNLMLYLEGGTSPEKIL